MNAHIFIRLNLAYVYLKLVINFMSRVNIYINDEKKIQFIDYSRGGQLAALELLNLNIRSYGAPQ